MVEAKEQTCKTISGVEYRNLIINAAYQLEKNKSEINDLNVFPVPDGDTGSNMWLTVGKAASELLSDSSERIDETAEKTAKAMLRGARGNSGVIISLMFRGIAKGLKNSFECDGAAWANALAQGVKDAYNAVENPAEGTILTVAKKCAQYAKSAAAERNDFQYVLRVAIEGAEKALQNTIKENPILEKAGVVDAGGMGWLVVMKAMYQTLTNQNEASLNEAEMSEKTSTGADFSAYNEENITFAYCTEFIIKKSDKEKDSKELKGYLSNIGDSLVFVDDGEIIKAHIHTNEPYKVLGKALMFGEYETVKVENMKTQHSEKISAQENLIPTKDYGFVSVASGDGIAELFGELGVDYVVSGGQTMNPSCEEIENAIKKVDAKTIFLLPNNKNIILTCQQVATNSDKNIEVIKTKTIPQGISAMLGFDEGLNCDENKSSMEKMAGGVFTFYITSAVRNSNFDNLDIKQGEFLALEENKPFRSGNSLGELIEAIGLKIKDTNKTTVSIYYGDEVSEYEAEKTFEVILEVLKGSEADINLYKGGQPVYQYIISAE